VLGESSPWADRGSAFGLLAAWMLAAWMLAAVVAFALMPGDGATG
jgi:hypothetical protein